MSTQFVQIENGTYRGKDVRGVFPLIAELKESAKGGYFITVDGKDSEFENAKMRVRVDYEDDIMLVDEQHEETDEEAINRIAERFEILEEMTGAAIDGVVRGMVVSGPPGVGKTFGVEQVLDKDSLFDQIASRPIRHTFIKGTMSPIGLYSMLFNYSNKDNVVVLDDCDSVLFNEDALNILKAALDSGSRRKICWNSDSSFLRREGVPSEFYFEGSIIFITNLKFTNVRSHKIKDHLDAIMSRCHYLDLTMDTTRDKILRIKQIARDGGLFDTKGLSKNQEDEIISFMIENQNKLREISLRMAQKIADLVKLSPANDRWKRIAETTCMKHK